MLICDTSGLIPYFDSADPHHDSFVAAIEADPGPFIVSPYVVAELDYLLATRRGVAAELEALVELGGGAWELPAVDAAGLRAISEIIAHYSDQEIGVADAAVVWLSGRYRTHRVLTLDRRHFTVLRTPSGRRFEVVPD